MLGDLRAAWCPGSAGVWSLWPGYLEKSADVEFEAELATDGIDLHRIHASGHATVADLQRLAAAVSPEALVPVHTQAPKLFTEVFAGRRSLAHVSAVRSNTTSTSSVRRVKNTGTASDGVTLGPVSPNTPP